MREINDINVSAALMAADIRFHDSIKVEDSWQRNGEKNVIIEVQYHDVTFEDLQRISKAFGTTKINIDNQMREEGWCETCRHSFTVTVLTIMGAVIADDWDTEGGLPG